MKESIFYNKDSSLTRYGLACGYVEKKESEKGWKEMYMEHERFHVRSGPKVGERWNVWEVFENDELTKARKMYKSIKI